MSNRLLLFTQYDGSEDIKLATDIFKTVFRKFRKTVYYSKLTHETVESQSEEAYEIVKNEIDRCDGVIGSAGRFSEKNAGTVFEAVKPYAAFHYCGRKCVVSPVLSLRVQNNDDFVECSKILAKKTAESTIEEVIKSVEGRKATIAVCDGAQDDFSRELTVAAERLFSRKSNITLERISLEEIIWQCRSIESFPDVFITGENENAALAFMCSLKPSSGAYVKYTGEENSVYMREKLPFSEITNNKALCIAAACAAVIEKELSMPKAADWLRRAMALSWEKCEKLSEEEFMLELSYRINDRIRKA